MGLQCAWLAPADCGPCRRDELLFFNRLGPAAAVPPAGNDAAQHSHGDRIIEIAFLPVSHWLRLQCRPILDPEYFPQLAVLTRGRCLEPLYQYVLCETDGGVALTAEQSKAFENGHHSVASHHQYHVAHPVPLRPTNAVFALQPHLPSGFLELPASALTTTPDPMAVPIAMSTSSFSTSALPSPAVSRALVQLAEGSVELFRHCMEYLDTNSLLFGALPALHSLPTVTAALTSNAYGRRVLMSRFGAWSDARLWSAELLTQWRTEGFERQREEVVDRHQYSSGAEKVVAALLEQSHSDQKRAHQRAVH